MKNRFFTLLVLTCFTFQSCCLPPFDCDDDFIEPPGTQYVPVYVDRAVFENSVALENKVAIGISGKIYVKDDLLFVNERNKGFHVFDNSDPANPKAIKFLEAPGATDMAIRNNMIYINQATDLIAVKFNAAENSIDLTKRIPNTFPPLRSPDGFDAYDIPENSVLIDWKPKK